MAKTLVILNDGRRWHLAKVLVEKSWLYTKL
jgi:hypothetical protein